MSESNEPKTNTTPGTPVPDLIEQYRIRRDAWIAQADELARLRDEVRGSAEREAMEIVTAARRDIRKIVMEARRELLVLAAQVQAALGDAGSRPPDPAALLNRTRESEEESEPREFKDAIFSPEEAVKGILDDARADMEALAEDARTVPFQSFAEPAQLPPAPEPPSTFFVEEPFVEPEPALAAASAVPSTSPSPAPSAPSSSTPSRVLLSSPYPSDSVPVPARRARTFVALFGAAGIAIVAGSIWWVRDRDRTAETNEAAAPAAATSPAPSSTASAEPPAASEAPAPADIPSPDAPLSLLVEARRSSWVRTTVDGESDEGRLLAEGETVRLNAKQSVSLRVGDAGAVFVSVNNGPATPLGRDGQVVTRQFVADNVERRASAAPAQPSPSNPPPLPLTASPAPIAAAPPTVPSPTSAVPFVQPVAAAPPPAAAAAPPSPPPARAEAAAPPTVAPRPEPAPNLTSPQSAVIAASRQWLDAYHRQDRAAMAALSSEGLQLADERRSEERFPSNVEVSRTLDRISVQIAADTAVLTAVMTERSPDNSVPPKVSPISQVWELRGNQWRVRQVRLVSEARLNQIFR